MSNKFLDFIIKNIDPVIVFLIIAGGYFQGLYLQLKIFTKNVGYDKTLKTLLAGTFFVLIYLTILSFTNSFPKEIWGKIFISYVVATSFYDIILRPFNEFIMTGLTKLHNMIASAFGGKGNKKPPSSE